MAYQMDFFAGIESKVLAAIENSKVKYPAYVFVRDEEASSTGRLAFVDQNNVLKYIRGENKKQVVNVTALPSVAEGDAEVLYIYEGMVYIFDGTDYVPMYKDISADLEELTQRVADLEDSVETIQEAYEETVTKVTNLEDGFSKIETEVDAITEQVTGLTEQIDDLEANVETAIKELDEKSSHVYEKVKYEFTDVPEGTLVNYREDEIRIMCPVGTTFTKQAVGAGGDANSYYGTLKVYVPNDAVAGCIEHLNDEADSEILTEFSTDKYGRRYQPTWLALAKYDDATSAWTYYGANSTVEKYIGWDYQIDWYDANGVMIASDCIRINLSNEACHSSIEPYYLVGLKAELEALKESNAEVVEKLDTVTETLTEVEERIVEVEKATLTFIELE